MTLCVILLELQFWLRWKGIYQGRKRHSRFALVMLSTTEQYNCLTARPESHFHIWMQWLDLKTSAIVHDFMSCRTGFYNCYMMLKCLQLAQPCLSILHFLKDFLIIYQASEDVVCASFDKQLSQCFGMMFLLKLWSVQCAFWKCLT